MRYGTMADQDAVIKLYRDVAAVAGGLARLSEEISLDYVSAWIKKSLEKGIWLLAIDKQTNSIIGSIHSYQLEPKVFSHVLSELTIAVSPAFQGKKVGRRLFTHFLDEIKEKHPTILRVELIARESNKLALDFYQSIGFRAEGRFEKRIKSVGVGFEADIPMAWLRQ